MQNTCPVTGRAAWRHHRDRLHAAVIPQVQRSDHRSESKKLVHVSWSYGSRSLMRLATWSMSSAVRSGNGRGSGPVLATTTGISPSAWMTETENEFFSGLGGSSNSSGGVQPDRECPYTPSTPSSAKASVSCTAARRNLPQDLQAEIRTLLAPGGAVVATGAAPAATTSPPLSLSISSCFLPETGKDRSRSSSLSFGTVSFARSSASALIRWTTPRLAITGPTKARVLAGHMPRLRTRRTVS